MKFSFVLGRINIFVRIQSQPQKVLKPRFTYRTQHSSPWERFIAWMNGAKITKDWGIYCYSFESPESLEHFHFVVRRPAFLFKLSIDNQVIEKFNQLDYQLREKLRQLNFYRQN